MSTVSGLILVSNDDTHGLNGTLHATWCQVGDAIVRAYRPDSDPAGPWCFEPTRDGIRELIARMGSSSSDHAATAHLEVMEVDVDLDSLEEMRWMTAPELIVGALDQQTRDEEGGTVGDLILCCPHPGCHGDAIYEVDRAERWNRVSTDVFEDEGYLVADQGTDHEFETVGWLCDTCCRPVTLPDGIDVEWG